MSDCSAGHRCVTCTTVVWFGLTQETLYYSRDREAAFAQLPRARIEPGLHTDRMRAVRDLGQNLRLGRLGSEAAVQIRQTHTATNYRRKARGVGEQ